MSCRTSFVCVFDSWGIRWRRRAVGTSGLFVSAGARIAIVPDLRVCPHQATRYVNARGSHFSQLGAGGVALR